MEDLITLIGTVNGLTIATSTIPSASPTGHNYFEYSCLMAHNNGNGEWGLFVEKNPAGIGTAIVDQAAVTQPSSTSDYTEESRHFIIHHVSGGGDTVVTFNFYNVTGGAGAKMKEGRFTRWRLDDNATPTNESN